MKISCLNSKTLKCLPINSSVEIAVDTNFSESKFPSELPELECESNECSRNGSFQASQMANCTKNKERILIREYSAFGGARWQERIPDCLRIEASKENFQRNLERPQLYPVTTTPTDPIEADESPPPSDDSSIIYGREGRCCERKTLGICSMKERCSNYYSNLRLNDNWTKKNSVNVTQMLPSSGYPLLECFGRRIVHVCSKPVEAMSYAFTVALGGIIAVLLSALKCLSNSMHATRSCFLLDDRIVASCSFAGKITCNVYRCVYLSSLFTYFIQNRLGVFINILDKCNTVRRGVSLKFACKMSKIIEYFEISFPAILRKIQHQIYMGSLPNASFNHVEKRTTNITLYPKNNFKASSKTIKSPTYCEGESSPSFSLNNLSNRIQIWYSSVYFMLRRSVHFCILPFLFSCIHPKSTSCQSYMSSSNNGAADICTGVRKEISERNLVRSKCVPKAFSSSSQTTLTSSRTVFLLFLLIAISGQGSEAGSPDAKRLYDDLLSNYNKLVRPVVNVTDVLTVRIKLKLSQLIDVNLKNQIMTTNLWVEQSWYDYKLIWEPKEYGGVEMLHVPSDHIWRPDIVLYNNADGNFEVTLSTKATLQYNGLVEWKPPAIYKSSCEIDVEYFPFDEQTCVMKFGSWTYDGFQVDLRHIDEIEGSNVVEMGVDLSEFYMSVEWDILEVPAVRHEKFYTCCDEPYLDITFNITMRRKTLFYTVNLIIPCMGISFLTVLTFYLPSDSGEKVTLSISILISLHVFFLLVVEIIPPTSLVIPLLGKYLIFAMILVSISISVTVLVLNVHFRSPQTHKMAPWVRRVFIHILPRLLIMKRPQYQQNKHGSLKSLYKDPPSRVVVQSVNGGDVTGDRPTSVPLHQYTRDLGCDYKQEYSYDTQPHILPEDFSPLADTGFPLTCRIHGSNNIHQPDSLSPAQQRAASQTNLGDCTDPYLVNQVNSNTCTTNTNEEKNPAYRSTGNQDYSHCSAEVHRACWCVNFIAEHTRLKEDSTKVKEDWKYVAMVLDRLFLWIFTLAVLVGTAGIILQAPSLYDDRQPLDEQYSEVFRSHRFNT